MDYYCDDMLYCLLNHKKQFSSTPKTIVTFKFEIQKDFITTREGRVTFLAGLKQLSKSANIFMKGKKFPCNYERNVECQKGWFIYKIGIGN